MRELNDEELEQVIYSPVCGRCLRLNDGIKKTCEAFPEGIPAVIWNGKNKHTAPYEGDHGLRYMRRTVRTGPKPQEEAARVGTPGWNHPRITINPQEPQGAREGDIWVVPREELL